MITHNTSMLTVQSSSPSGEVRTATTDMIEVTVPTIPPTIPKLIINIFFVSDNGETERFVNKSINGGNTKNR